MSDSPARTIAAVALSVAAGAAAGWYLCRLQAAQSASSSSADAGPAEKATPTAQQTLALIKARRTIFPKDLTGEQVPKAAIEALLEAANWAPTHNLTQPWRFVVLQGAAKAKFEDLTVELVGKYSPEDKRAATIERVVGKSKKTWPLVSAYIAICMKKVPSPKGGKPNPEWEDLCSVGAAVQNMYLVATSMGIAPYWSSWNELARDTPEMHEFLGLQEGDRCLGVFNLGKSDRMDSYRGTRHPWQDKVTWKV